jgi:uncharacterized protein (TIGR03435 family)
MHSITILLSLSAVAAMAQPEFEVASIKPAAPTQRPDAFSLKFDPGLMHGTNVPLYNLFLMSYQLQRYEIAAPDWMKSAKFDLSAKAASVSTLDEMRPMLRKLLADRFRLKFHIEKREILAFVLLLGKGGPKFPVAKEGPVPVPDSERIEGGFGMGPMFQKVSMVTLARNLSGMCGLLDFLPVIDGTGLKGEFDVRIRTPDFPTPDPDGGRRSIYDTYCEVAPQIGLEFKRQKVAIDIYVIDSAEKMPTAN